MLLLLEKSGKEGIDSIMDICMKGRMEESLTSIRVLWVFIKFWSYDDSIDVYVVIDVKIVHCDMYGILFLSCG